MPSYNRHYPFAQRQYAISMPWVVDQLAVPEMVLANQNPKDTGANLFVDDITLAIDEPGLNTSLGPLPHTGRNNTYMYQPSGTIEAGLPAGWTIGITDSYVRCFLDFRRQPVGLIDQLRPDRRVYSMDYGIRTEARFSLLALGPGATYLVQTRGTWSIDYTAADPPAGNSFWVQIDSPPTLHRRHQQGHRDCSVSFSTFASSGHSALGTGTVPVSVSSYMLAKRNAIRDALVAANWSATFRVTTLGYALSAGFSGNLGYLVDTGDLF